MMMRKAGISSHPLSDNSSRSSNNHGGSSGRRKRQRSPSSFYCCTSNNNNDNSSPSSSSNHCLSTLVILSADTLLTVIGIVCCMALMAGIYMALHLEDGATAATSATSSSSILQQQQPVLTENVVAAKEAAEQVRQEFYRRYGGKEESLAMYERAVHAFGGTTSLQATAERMLRATAQERPFVLAFAGYSVTVGRGNYYHQSFPFVVGRVLEPLLQQSVLKLPVQVINAAIGGIPSFPYGFCFEHFLGPHPDVMSWDYSMNEGNGGAVLESYIRHSQQQLSASSPMLIVLDTNKNRCSLIQQYTEQGYLKDAMCVGKAQEAVSHPEWLAKDAPQESIPLGFQQWHEFGAPPSCPGRGSWHPKKMEHEWMGWVMAMYFVQAFEHAMEMIQTNASWKAQYATPQQTQSSHVDFPPPFQTPPDNDVSVTELLFGHPTTSIDEKKVYRMKQLSCRTNFLPATDHDKVLPSIVVSGLSPGITAENIMTERTEDAYATGWVLDVSSLERDTKVKVESCGGLGYVDMKIALYGIPESGPLRLWLPVEGKAELEHQQHNHDDGESMLASHWLDDLIFCEANEKRPEKACHLDQDLIYTVGGVVATEPRMIAGAAEYLKRKTCVHVAIPATAQMTQLHQLQQQAKGADSSQPISEEIKRRLLAGKSSSSSSTRDDKQAQHLGLVVDIQVKEGVTRKEGACCLSHIVWEQH